MLRKSWAALAVTATAAVSVLGATTALAVSSAESTRSASNGSNASGSSWRIVKRLNGGSSAEVTAMTAVGRAGGWAFDGLSSPTAWERDGSAWSRVPFPGQANEEVVTAAATSANDVWAFTDNGSRSRALRWNGSKWSVAGTFSRDIGGAAVLGPSDVWVFGQPLIPGQQLGAWHYNGHGWSQVTSGRGLEGGSALSTTDIWAFEGTGVAHWNGRAWNRTSVARLLPAKQFLNDPSVTGIYAQSPDSVYAVGNGNQQDDGGPLVVLHYNGHSWSKVAQGNDGYGTQPLQQITSDGRGGIWIPAPGFDGQNSYLLHYLSGHLTAVPLPVAASKIAVLTVAQIPGTTDILAGGDTHAPANNGQDEVAVLLEYAP